jgi:hypothetical protein
MRTAVSLAAFTVAVLLLAAMFVDWTMPRESPAGRTRSHIVLIGASIGRGWSLQQWPARVSRPDYSAEALAVWDFNKSVAVEELLLRPGRPFHLTRTWLKSLFEPPPRVPDIVILKECSSYFPGNLPAQRAQTTAWVERLRQRGIPVMLATVVPVTPARDSRSPGKQASLLAYNRWLRDYARQAGAGILDLERALSDGGGNAWLSPRFAAPDGTHLNAAAYAVLDRLLLSALEPPGPG